MGCLPLRAKKAGKIVDGGTFRKQRGKKGIGVEDYKEEEGRDVPTAIIGSWIICIRKR
jgi:hypothetical protein